ncbi:MAG: hypothetical protein CMJ24_12220 [Phycisphaerae bacterium]|jgi:hypothetical protein|nr:hypothetical protein [Phycisphaerae bacterium]MDG1899416.1 hypothetical protein [Phycisphaerales bacterium]|tara:strand:- start:9237 stop:9911 length:675 start_codon:yes stop_codon:yes gene_type:complete
MATPPHEPDNQDHDPDIEDGAAAVEEAAQLLQSWTHGDLRFDDNIVSCKFVRTDEGRLVAAVMVAALHTADTVLMIPDEHAPVLELLLTMEPFDENGPDGRWVDRWRIYHGEEDDINWVFLDIDMGRMSGIIIDGDALMIANVLAEDEAGLCRAINDLGTQALQELCRNRLDKDVETPLVVGVDPGGLDVRAKFDVLRIPFPVPMELPEDIVRITKDWAAPAKG